ncbi:cysteine desulfurase-like protein [Candidatus Planktophila lacus]|uniref:Cysteine desulfurase-like protein n=1 Tax=Candidatus Planktophila lacus TaxID=1884913 RepID=A0AAD0E4R7_9ACTN|nr:cysteine desulfurase-like protein [Candidatus Planktophila lacus]ASY10881.1 cysteine desulfurase-like protein [Candidatus Planktophila lacus]
MSYDVNKVRASFPSLNTGLAFFCGPGGSQVPDVVGQTISDAITKPISNRNVNTESEKNAEEIVLSFRAAVADLIDVDPRGVVYGRSWTQLTYDFSRTLAKNWGPGDEVVVTTLDHDSNVRPWVQAAEAVGATVRWAQLDPTTTELSVEAVESVLSAKTKLVAVTGAGNTIGTRPDLKAIGAAVHKVGALFYVDAVHLTPHAPISAKEIGADFIGFSFYKMFGPHCAALAAAPALLETLQNDKLLPATNVVPERFEFGTLPYELMAGSVAAIEYIANLAPGSATSRRDKIVNSMRALETYEDELLDYMESSLKALPGITLYGHAKKRTPTLYFSFKGFESAEIYKAMAKKSVTLPASNFYALETSRKLGLGDAGALRAGLAPYSTREDVDRLVAGLKEIIG